MNAIAPKMYVFLERIDSHILYGDKLIESNPLFKEARRDGLLTWEKNDTILGDYSCYAVTPKGRLECNVFRKVHNLRIHTFPVDHPLRISEIENHLKTVEGSLCNGDDDSNA